VPVLLLQPLQRPERFARRFGFQMS
jgi:hypothetical protein